MIDKILTPDVVIAGVSLLGIMFTGWMTHITKVRTSISASELGVKIDGINTKVTTLEELYTKLNESKTVRSKRVKVRRELTEVITESLRFATEQNLKDYIALKAEAITDLVDKTLVLFEESSDVITANYVRDTISAAVTKINMLGNELLSKSFIEDYLYPLSRIEISTYENKLCEVVNDVENNKITRIGALSVIFLQSNLSLTIREFNKYKNSTNEGS